MALVLGTFYTQSTSQTGHTVTVPVGVTTSHVAFFAMGTGDGVTVTVTPSTSGSGTITAIDAGTTATNCRVAVFKGTGLVAGDTVTFTLSVAKQLAIGHEYRDDITSTIGTTASAIRPGSQATTLTGALTPAASQLMLNIFVDRTSTTPTLSSVVSSGGEGTTVDSFSHSPGTAPVVGVAFATYVASAAASRTVTATYSGASGNGYGLALPLTLAVISRSITDSTGSTDSGQVIDRAGSITENAGNTDVATTSSSVTTNISFTDSLGLTDTGQKIDRAGTLNENGNGSDSVNAVNTPSTVNNVSITDSRGATDTGQKIDRDGVMVEDNTQTDTAPGTIIPPTGLAVSFTDSTGSTDSIVAGGNRDISITDDRGATEWPDVGYVVVSESITDSGGRTDTAAPSVAIAVLTITDTMTLTDTLTVVTTRGFTESLGRTDTMTVDLGVRLTDATGSGDIVTAFQSPGGTQVGTIIDFAGRTDSIIIEIAGSTFVPITDTMTLTDSITISTESRLCRLVPSEDMLFVDARYERRRRRGSRWIGVYGFVQPIRTEAGLLLWKDGRVAIVRQWPDYTDADDQIAGGHEWRGMENSWQAQVLRDNGFTLEPVT